MNEPQLQPPPTRSAPPFHATRIDRFEDWLRAPAPLESKHPQFDIRRAIPTDFERIYELVDETFGFNRSHDRYDWIYRRNPSGLARCWLTFDRASGRLVGSWASWPWPMARGTQWVEGCQDGDWVVARGWQRHGTGDLCAEALRSHAWQANVIRLAWPNEKSRGVAMKHGHGTEIIGPVPKAVLILRGKDFLKEIEWPALLGALGGKAADVALMGWSRIRLHRRAKLKVEEVRHFDAGFDDVTQRCMSWDGYWSPHDAAFMNWRYLHHPSSQHCAFAMSDERGVIGYYILKIEQQRCWLMEFVTPLVPSDLRSTMLLHLIGTARAQGCHSIQFSAPPGWRHWRFLRSAGFIPVPSGIFQWPWPNEEEPERGDLNMWQWVPGDMDFR